MQGHQTVSGAITQKWFEELVAQGMSPKQLEEKTGLDRSQLKDPDARISLNQHQMLMELGMDWAENPTLALQMEEKFNHEHLGIVGHVFMNSLTLREASLQITHYAPLICEKFQMELREEGEHALIIHRMGEMECSASLALAMRMIREFTGLPTNPIEVHLQQTLPEHPEEYRRIFQAPVLFNQPENMIVLEKKYLDCQRPSHNPYLQNILLKHADELLKELESEESFQEQVQGFVSEHLATGEIDIEKVSEHFHMSRWTLNRKLKEEGISFQELFQQMRKDLAINYLQKKNFSINEVAYLVGFSEPSTFHRAFKNWLGKSPGEFRKSRMTLLAA